MQRPASTAPPPYGLLAAVLLGIGLVLLGGKLLSAQSYGGSVVDREYPLKAAYLYNFGGYIEWPAEAFANASSPFVIGVLGEAPFGSTLDEIARRKIAGRQVVVKKFASSRELVDCHILYVASSVSDDERRATVERARGKPLLLVGESVDFTKHGGAVRFYLEQNRVRFEINTAVTKAQRLKVSSKLLSLATLVASRN